jgi:hypothetical protein
MLPLYHIEPEMRGLFSSVPRSAGDTTRFLSARVGWTSTGAGAS